MTIYRVRAPRTAIFPVDMLRFAYSWPATSDDATAIERSLRLEYNGRQEITLSTAHPADSIHMFAAAKRWNSMGWRVDVMTDAGDWEGVGPFIHEPA